MQRKSGKFLLIGLALLASPGSGCGPGSSKRSPGTSKKFDGVVLRLACPDSATHDAVKEYGSAWASAVGARLVLSRYDPAKGAPTDADVWVLEAARLPARVSAGQLLPLPAAVRDDPAVAFGGLLLLYREYLLVWDRTAYALPLRGDAPLCFYRKDLFEDAKHQAAFLARHGRKLQAPATWQEYADIAEYFYRRRRAKPGPSLPPLPASTTALDWLFNSVAAPVARRAIAEDTPDKNLAESDLFAFYFDLKTGKPRIAAPGFVHTLALLRRLQAFRLRGSSAEPWRAFAKGDAVLCLDQCGRLAEFQKRGSRVRDRVGVCAIPGSRVYFDYDSGEQRTLEGTLHNRVPYLGAGVRLLVVPRSARNPEAAFALVAELGGRATAEQLVVEPRWGGGMVRQSQLDREHWDSFGLETETGRALKLALRQTVQPGIRNPLLCLRVPDQAAFVEALAKEVRKALESAKPEKDGDTSAARALKAVDSRWQAIIEKDSARHLRNYRLSLGRDLQGR